MSKLKKKSRLKLKEITLTYSGIALLVFSFMLLPQSASAVDLRAHSVISDNMITLGDLFSGLDSKALSHKADRVLGAAPRPGDEMVLNARTLMRIAIALDLPWRPSSSADQVVLRRAATVIDRDMIEETLSDALMSEGLEGKFNLIISGEMAEMILPPSAAQNVEISALVFYPEQNRFEAELAAPSKENPVKLLKIQGQIQRLVSVPVLRATLRHGDVIGLRDLDSVDIPERRLKHNIILEAQNLVGLTPRRILLADKPIKENDLEAPRIVSRGENVTMIFREGGLLLTAQGKAMEFGAKGDAIRVVNLNSSKTIEAIVTGEKEVTVRSF